MGITKNMKKIAIVGAGYMAFEHAKAFSSLEEFKIVGVFSRTKEKATTLAKQYNAVVFDSILEMFEETQADLVIVAVNELSMFDVCNEIFKYPWLCFLEKPVGYNYQQAQQINTLALNQGHKPFVALNRRSYSSTRSALEYLKSDDPGARLVSVLDQQDMNVALKMGTPELVVSNYMYANSIHLIDYFNIFCRGKVLSVEQTVPWNEGNPEYVVATIKYSSGDIGVYQAVWNGPGPWSVSVTNSNYRLELGPLEALKVQKRGERVMQKIEVDSMDLDFKPGLYYQALEIVNYFKGKVVKLATLKDATSSMKLSSIIYGLNC